MTKESQQSTSRLKYVYDQISGKISFSFKSGALYYRVTFGKNGFNQLPNFISIEQSRNDKSWLNINSSTTDWLPPLRVAAVADGDGSSKFATGGNHGNVDKAARGDQTARNIKFEIQADGRALSQSTTGFAQHVEISIKNEVMGWNTTRTIPPRYIMEQSFKLLFQTGECKVEAKLKALEDVALARDSALQCVTSGFQEQAWFLGSDVQVPYVDGISSGASSQFPHVYGVGLFSSINGQMSMWLDRNWEAGRGEMILEEHPHVRLSGNKAYLAVALDVDANQKDIGTTIALRSGDTYRYRGGYSWLGTKNIQHMQS